MSLVASCELEQPALQQLLYDIEAGMPFLFVDQLVAQALVARARRAAGPASCCRCRDYGRENMTMRARASVARLAAVLGG